MSDLSAEVLARQVEVLTAELGQVRRHNDQLRRECDQQVRDERDDIMRKALRAKPLGERWMAATRRLTCDDVEDDPLWTLHVRDPWSTPSVVPPTGKTGRYLSGGVRSAGPGSHIGTALCGLPLMADELWVTADHILPRMSVELCGMCSYLSGQPTLEAARAARVR